MNKCDGEMMTARKNTAALIVIPVVFALVGCNGAPSDPKAEAPPPLTVQKVEARDVFAVEHPDQFPLVQAGTHTGALE